MPKKITIELIKEELQASHPEAKLVSTEYIYYKSKLDLICEKGHNFKITCSDLKVGRWCSECAGNKKKTIEDVLNFIKANHPEAKLVSTEYINYKSKLDLICEKGHKFKMNCGNIINKHWCPECYGNKKLTLEYVKQKIEELHPGSKILDQEYINSKTKLNVICENNHNFMISHYKFKIGQWCPTCSVKKGEALVRKIFEDKFKKSFPNMKPKWLINPKTNYILQLDGFCEELKLAFEYQGIQHYKYPNHCHKNKKEFEKQIYRDKIKKDLCKENNVKLIEIKEIRNLSYENVSSVVNSSLEENNIVI